MRLGRPIFLLGGFALYGLGALAAVRRGYAFDANGFVIGQIAVTAIQLMTHYSNDYFDYEADKANLTPTRWSGGSRVLASDELPRAVALYAALVVGLVAPIAVLLLLARGPSAHAGAALLLLVVQALAWSHAGPPLRLHSRGFGELTTALVVPLLTPLVGFIVQAGRVELFPIVLSAPLCLLQLVMLITIEFPDHAGDRAVGKLSWVVLFGAARAARLAQALLVLAFVFAVAGLWFELPVRVVYAWVLLVPLAVFQLVRLARRDFERPAAWESLTFGAVALFFLAIVLDLLALAWRGP